MSQIPQRSFASGEINPALYPRVDTSRYQQGLRTLSNAWVKKEGGAENRPGTSYICSVRNPAKRARIYAVETTGEPYIYEFGDTYVRAIQSDRHIFDFNLDNLVISGVTQATQGVVTSTSHGLNNGQHVWIENIVGMTQLNNREFIVSDKTAHTFKIKYLDGSYVNTAGFTAYGSGGLAHCISDGTTSYLEAELAYIQFAIDSNYLFSTHKNYAIGLLSTASLPQSFSSAAFTSPRRSDGATFTYPTSVANNGAAGSATLWVVTSYDPITGEESLPSPSTGSSATPSSGSPINITWNDFGIVPTKVRVYKKSNGVFGYIGTTNMADELFVDNGIVADVTINPPETGVDFSAAFPSVCGNLQGRFSVGNIPASNPLGIWMSAIASTNNFLVRTPRVDSDMITTKLTGIGQLRSIVDIEKPVVITSKKVIALNGDEAGSLTPTAINASTIQGNGGAVMPQAIPADGSALYIENGGGAIRDVAFKVNADGYNGTDLSVFSKHLLEGFTIVEWAYQQAPNSMVWMVRSDGVLLSMTYFKEQNVIGFGRHSFQDGEVESVTVASSDSVDTVYLIVKRTINGSVTRNIEKLNSRFVTEETIKDAIFMDSAMSYDGRNTSGAHTMILSGGTDWTYEELLTLTSSTSFFAATDVGNVIQLTGADDELIRFTIETYSSTTVVTGKAHKTVPASLRTTATADWAKAVTQITGLWHLEGEHVAVFGDGYVAASPFNEAYTVVAVTSGTVTLDKAYAVIHIGLPYLSDIETLDLDQPQGESLVGRKKKVNKVTVYAEKTRGVWVGGKPPTDDDEDPIEDLYELKIRNDEDYESSVALVTGSEEINVTSLWSSNGRVFLRQVDPVPMCITAIVPDFEVANVG